MKRGFIVSLLLSATLYAGIASAAGTDEARKLQDSFSAVAEKAFPAVVVINVKKDLPRESNPGENPFFNEQFRRFKGPRNQESPKIEGKGSGFIADEKGFVITNCHVADGGDEVTVKLYDGREFKAEIVGTDAKTDIALLRIKADDKLPVLKFADSDKVKVGHWSIAIGAPYSFDYSMTAGIVSQKGRSVGINAYENYIQTDAAINMGNSGGPLLNIDGDVIGVNDFIVTGNGYSQGNIGLGFAIPSNMVKEVMEQLMKDGKVVRPWVGIAMEPLTPEMKKNGGAESGVLVREVNVGNPADKAGMEPGDVIVAVDGQPAVQPKDIQFAVLKHKPGDKIVFTVIRDGKKQDITVVAEKQDDRKVSASDGNDKGGVSSSKDFGIELSEAKDGIEVSKVANGSPAASAGIEEGMKVLAINRMRVKSLADANKALSLTKDTLLLFVSDGSTKRFVVIEKK